MACGTADILIWQTLSESNCTYRSKAEDQLFCRSVENATGLCDRKSCPLANSQYATTRLIAGKIYLEIKTPERAHTPAKMWQKIELSENVSEAMDVIEEELQYWDEWLIEKVKQRYVRLHETLENMRRMKQAPKVKALPIKNKLEKRNRARERRALSPMLNTRSKKNLSRACQAFFPTVINSGEEKENGPRLPVFFCADTMNN